ncbi:MAG: restriction endonuclease subunit S [Pseudanabaena sp.]|nr:restriction endonuclease subunit S [Pseudanabaena sp. M090S1SP2A07QC]MCA6506112.1 restriction endonuclease subunit S [Pseudanabaena sp. M172S2SP2A07QC]MCA6519007.1 restriction endonuclease subunit S [Pseudanabaena sp. M110S1SP2A07QC]MCA6522543.1 restriction endonuclease subunit S [Pseudanabaena sp. M051S1SP2A07QC]MCA6527555.1 restriction endonuclease subunit S [Pseudanabaena sp. M179S2SP2A07QC]MCA6532522.1 restriction endonuclease subunit S [Pseudanabaena sp. M125S2SP2A07QC]MCA6532819.1 re
MARTGGTVGKTYLVKSINVRSVFASYLIRVIPSVHIDVDCLKYFLESPLYWRQLYEKCSGTGQPNVNGTSLSTLFLSLPPLAEQRRIVAKEEIL